MSTTSTSRSPSKEPTTQGATQLVLAAHPQRLLDALDHRLTPAVVDRLRACARLHTRIAPLLVQRLAGDETDSLADDAMALADRQAAFAGIDLKEASCMAGAAWHALSLRQMIRGREVADLVARIGRRAHAFGLRREGVAPVMRSVEPDALAERIMHDGYACVGVWLSSFPASMRQQLLIRLPPGTPAEAPDFSDAQRSRALGLIDPVLSEFDESENASA